MALCSPESIPFAAVAFTTKVLASCQVVLVGEDPDSSTLLWVCPDSLVSDTNFRELLLMCLALLTQAGCTRQLPGGLQQQQQQQQATSAAPEVLPAAAEGTSRSRAAAAQQQSLKIPAYHLQLLGALHTGTGCGAAATRSLSMSC